MFKGRSRKMLVIGIALLALLHLLPSRAMAAEPSFSLAVSPEKASEGKQVSVKVTGSNLTEVYGYELKLSFDEQQLRYVKAISTLGGFSVQPKDTAEGKLIFAHTKIGNAPGVSGEAELVTITFSALGGSLGETVVTLDQVKLISSNLKSSDVTAKVSARVQVTPVQETTPITFTDLNGHWGKNAIERAATLAFVNGYADGTFRPNDNVTRAEFTAMITRAFTLKFVNGVTPEFADAAKLPGWARTSIAEAAAAGIVTGYSDKTFRPNQLITRTEMTAILARVLELDAKVNADLTFEDKDHIAKWASSSIAAAVQAGIVKGSGGNLFLPNKMASRAEAVSVIISGLDHLALR